MYGIGDLIVYAGEGVCRVEGIGVPPMTGVNKQRQYYTLKPLYREGMVYAPVDTGVFMRPVISRDDADALIDRIPPELDSDLLDALFLLPIVLFADRSGCDIDHRKSDAQYIHFHFLLNLWQLLRIASFPEQAPEAQRHEMRRLRNLPDEPCCG